MDQKMIVGSTLTAEGKELSIEDRNEICREEIMNIGFLRNYRLADATSIPTHQSIALRYNEGQIYFEKMPEEISNLYILIKQNHVDIFSRYFEGLDKIFPDREIIRIASPKIDHAYDLGLLSGRKAAGYLKGSGVLYFENTISGPDHYLKTDASGINVIILKDGYIRIDLVKLICESISFRLSDVYENAFDVFVDEEPRPGDSYITNVENGMIIYSPTLTSALKHQATLGPIDMNKGIYYASCAFRIVPGMKTGQLIDVEKYHDQSSIAYNLELLANR